MRTTDTHIFFKGGLLSNWDKTVNFSGARAFQVLKSRLDSDGLDHSTATEYSSNLIERHRFNCGEQFMMACKAWLFENDPTAPLLKSILATKNPRDQKAFGRRIPNFSDQIWTPASIHVVVAAQIARAEVSPELSSLYETSGNRTFVEGSAIDKVWGVGLDWQDREIDDERNWQGENRLGVCHGLAREVMKSERNAKVATTKQD